MFFALLCSLLLLYPMGKKVTKAETAENKSFIGEETWDEHQMNLCETQGRLNESLSCYSHIFNYQRLNVEVLSEDPILIIYRNFASEKYVADFLADARKLGFEKQHVMDLEKEELGSSKAHPSRIANGTWIEHKASSGVAKMFRRVTAMLPFVNFESSELWQVLSYHRGGHYAPHYDYIDDEKDSWSPRYGSRFATFLLMLQPATKGGGTVFPLLETAVMPSVGDAVFWTNMNTANEKELNTIHGGCVVWEGEKLATTLWIRAKDQELLRSPLRDGRFDIEKLIRPRLEYFGMTPVEK